MRTSKSAAPTDRLFFALRPDAGTAARIHRLTLELAATLGLKGRPLPQERLHVTLLFLGDHAGLPQPLLHAADAAARCLAFAPFELTFDHVRSFASARGAAPLVLCSDACPPLPELRHALLAGLQQDGVVPADARPFVPHITLLHDSQVVPRRAVEAVTWTAAEVLLIRSRIGRGQHDVLQRYPLAR